MTATLTATSHPTPGPSRTLVDVLRTCSRGLGQILITLGVVILLFCGYELWFTNIYTHRAQDRLSDELARQWANPPVATAPVTAPAVPTGTPPRTVADVPLGTGLAVLRLPRFGSGYHWVVSEGVSHDVLKDGPGHYPGTAMPGGVGNFVVSGHRTTYGAPFNRLAEMRPGDAVVVETRDTWFTYRVTGEQIVSPTDIAVIDPVSGQPGVAPSAATLTFTTCHPMYSARQRLILHAALESTLAKSVGPPPALQGS